MVLYPDIQARARAELNQVVKHDRMPSIHDRGSLPYLEAILREVLRWSPVVPLGRSSVNRFCGCITERLEQECHTQHLKMMSMTGTSYLKV
jgi:hypothetical protein